jgi:hypothetical protein
MDYKKRKEDVLSDIKQLLGLRANLQSIENIELEFKALQVDAEKFDRLNRQQILTSLTSLFTELGKCDFRMSVEDAASATEANQ